MPNLANSDARNLVIFRGKFLEMFCFPLQKIFTIFQNSDKAIILAAKLWLNTANDRDDDNFAIFGAPLLPVDEVTLFTYLFGGDCLQKNLVSWSKWFKGNIIIPLRKFYFGDFAIQNFSKAIFGIIRSISNQFWHIFG